MSSFVFKRLILTIHRCFPNRFVKCSTNIYLPTNCYHTSHSRCSLTEFFDDSDNWKKSDISVGRPWRKDELRLKSNGDLHKLWYVLLKERNMLFTMEAEYKRQVELFPNPDRIEKVEESMENLIEVVQERDRAYHLLETGETGEPPSRWVYNALGIGGWRTAKEHVMPIHMNPTWLKYSELSSTNRFKWAIKYKRLYREKKMRVKAYYERQERLKMKTLKEMYPDAELD